MNRGDRKSELEAAQQTIKFFETLLRASVDGIVITDSAQNIIVVNDAFCNLLGRRRQELTETSLFAWLDQISAEASDKWIELEKQVHINGSCHHNEFRVMTKNRIRHFSVNASLMDRVAHEETGVIVSIWRDITDYRMAEESVSKQKLFFESILETIIDGVWVTNKESIIFYTNKGMETIAGIKKKQMTGSHVLKDFPESTLKYFRQYYMKAQETLTPVHYDKVHVITPSGRDSYQSGWIIPLVGNNEFNGMICTTQDVTEHIQAEKQIRQSLKEKEVLLKEVHHRVKNNMQLIISMLTLQQHQSCETDSGVLEDVINRIRVFGDIHRRLYEHDDISRIDFVQHLKENLETLIKAYNIDKKKIELKLNIKEPAFSLDQALSCGLLMNELISNTLKYAFTDQGKISISITHGSDGKFDKIVYSDNGKGIETLSGGFGTKIIYALADQLNMSVHVSAKDGTQFDFSRKGKDHIEKHSGEILYVEDEVLIAMEKIAYLKENGYSVNEKIIISGEKAVKYVKESIQKPSLIIMDIGLKGMNGIDAAKEIRRDNPFIPIIFLSGYEDAETKSKMKSISNTDFLNKMSTPEEMKRMIDKYQTSAARTADG
ncbi:MAG: PAS domain S-box protein [Desulfobacteraceae bacterium]|nr:PAS domain S-box protein [Desulfobacteraceae bacterium]